MDSVVKESLNTIQLRRLEMRTLILNIGLETSENFGVKMELEADIVKEFLELNGFKVIASKVEQSNTEQTLIATVEVKAESFESEMFELSHKLEQDCIAFYDVEGQKGYLVGEYAEDWGGEFKPEYFLI